MRIMKHYFAFVSRNRYIVQKKLKNIVVLGLKSKKVYETINSELSILGLFNHNRELLFRCQEQTFGRHGSPFFIDGTAACPDIQKPAGHTCVENLAGVFIFQFFQTAATAPVT